MLYIPVFVGVLNGVSGESGANEAGDEENSGSGTHFECCKKRLVLE